MAGTYKLRRYLLACVSSKFISLKHILTRVCDVRYMDILFVRPIITLSRQVAQRATIAHLRANFTFSYCKSTGDDDPWGMANLDPRSMIGRIY